jgi:hypothetical protein
MGARFMANTIQGSRGISNLTVKNDTEFSFDYQPSEGEIRHYKAYAPTRDDYEVNTAVIDKALSNGFNLIVFDHWIFATSSGKDYSSIQGIPIYSVPDFIKAIKKRDKLDNE